MSTVLVTGANGMLGVDLCQILQKNNYNVIETDVYNLDITKFDQVERTIKQFNPEYVIHCAAYTNVEEAEKNVEQATKVNVLGTENVSKVCGELNSTLIYVSTDYVFAGEKRIPYTPQDAVNPLNIYGRTKYDGECKVREYCKKHYIVRTSWLYGLNGKNFVETMLSLSKRNDIKVVDDQFGSPTWTVDLANAIVSLIKTKPSGTYHICGDGSTTWYNFAKTIYELAMIDLKIEPCSSVEYKTLALRPSYSVMDNEGFCRDWKLALRDYIKLRQEKKEFLK